MKICDLRNDSMERSKSVQSLRKYKYSNKIELYIEILMEILIGTKLLLLMLCI